MNPTNDKGNARSAHGRSVYGPRPLGTLVPSITRPAFRKRAPAAAQVLADWPQLVGPEMAAQTQPRKLAGGTLTLACSGAMALELQHTVPQLIARLNSRLGHVVVERIRFQQDWALDPPLPAAPRPQAIQAAREAVRDLPEGPLRDALESLGRHVLMPRRD